MVFDWLRKGKKEEPKGAALPIADLPSWLDLKEAGIRREEHAGVSTYIGEFSGAVAEIRGLLRNFGEREDDEPVHPKLDKVTRDSLPLFEKAITAHLSRKMPDDPWDFYQAAAECLKGCLKSLNGPGRYLTNLYPAEMKAIRAAIDRAGRSVNGMTPILKDTRERLKKVEEARGLARRYRELSEERAGAGARIATGSAAIAGFREKIATCDRENAALEKGGEFQALSALKGQCSGKRKECVAAEAEIHTALSTILHVLRKGQNVASKDRREGVREIHRAVDLLEAGTLPEPDSVSVIEAALTYLTAMTTSGEVVLKNKEEKAIFSDPAGFFAQLRFSYAGIAKIRGEIDLLEREIRHHPVTVSAKAIADERVRLVRQCREESRQKELALQRVRHAEGEIPAAGERLAKIVESLSAGEGVSLVLPEQPSAA